MIEHILLSAMRLISKKPEQLIEILAVAGGFIAVVYILRRYIVGFISSKFPRLLAFFNKAGTAISFSIRATFVSGETFNVIIVLG